MTRARTPRLPVVSVAGTHAGLDLGNLTLSATQAGFAGGACWHRGVNELQEARAGGVTARGGALLAAESLRIALACYQLAQAIDAGRASAGRAVASTQRCVDSTTRDLDAAVALAESLRTAA